MLVQLHGYSTESAFSGTEALEKVRNHVPDVVFLDLMLPDLDGYEVCRALKSSGSTNQVPIVIVTAKSPPRTASKASTRVPTITSRSPTLRTRFRRARAIERARSGEHRRLDRRPGRSRRA